MISSTSVWYTSSGTPRDPVVRRTAAALARALGLPGGDDAPAERETKPRASEPEPEPEPEPQAEPPAPSATPTPAPSQSDALLDYLFGGEG